MRLNFSFKQSEHDINKIISLDNLAVSKLLDEMVDNNDTSNGGICETLCLANRLLSLRG